MVDNVEKLSIGQKVHYQPDHYSKDEWDNGIVKTIPDKFENFLKKLRSPYPIETVWVVYSCNHDWDNFQNYTGESTYLKDLHLGWKPKREIKQEGK